MTNGYIEYIDIVSALAGILDKTFGYPIHSDEVLEGFEMPCFFIKIVPVTDIETLNVTSTSLTAYLTYFTNHRDEVEYLDVEDKVKKALDIGFKVGSRFIHISDISDTRAGQDEDILQIAVNMTYYNKTQHLINKHQNAEAAGDVAIDLKNNDTGDNTQIRLEQPDISFHERGDN